MKRPKRNEIVGMLVVEERARGKKGHERELLFVWLVFLLCLVIISECSIFSKLLSWLYKTDSLFQEK